MAQLSLLLSAMSDGGIVGIAVGVAIIGLVLGAVSCYFVYKKYLNTKINSAKSEAERIIEEANLEAKNIRKDGLIDAKEQMNKMRDDFEKETRERKQDWQRTENRLAQKESALDKKEDLIDKKSASLDKKIEDAERVQKQNEETKERLKLLFDAL